MRNFPKARKRQLVVRELDRETIVYNTSNHEAICLDEIAGQVWNLCDGKRNIVDISAGCDFIGANEDAVTLALEKLSKANLLEVPFKAAPGTNRREMMGQMAGVAGLAAAVTVMTVPTAADAASGLACGETCNNTGQCAGSLTCEKDGTTASSKVCAPPGYVPDSGAPSCP